MSVFDRLKSSKRTTPPAIAIYGTPGVGKTSLAAEFPDPIYLYVEGEEPPDGVDLPSDEITSFAGLLDTFADLLNEEHPFKTVIIDSLDKVEPMVWAATCQRNQWDSIDSNDKGSPTAFGKGYLAADVEWGEYHEAISALNRAGLYVVQILHSETKRHDDPLVDAYDRYRPKLQKRALELVVENCKALLFLNRRTSVKRVEASFGGKKTSKPEGMSGAERIIHTDERAGFYAKNRFKGAPAQITYRPGQGFAELSKYLMTTANDNSASTEAA
ncbi:MULTISPECIES: ATP-binding protein [unclassified Sinorhizobium]|uniref:ATP-binding protein n=1 Tax=unclassified Sinorhizobium TaxID=2613772 RepID=UPI003525C7FC